jgi:DNA-binding transcriptional LysR family regulator
MWFIIQRINLSGFDLNLLVALDALLQERSVTRAAARVGLSQPAMSNALARLRALLGDPLFHKRATNMVPTARALAPASPIRNSLAQLRAALREQPGFDPSSSRKVFIISATDYVGFLLFGSLLRDVASDGPQIQIKSSRPDQLFFIPEAALHESTVDAAIGIFPNPVPTSSEIRTQTLIEEENVCIAR